MKVLLLTVVMVLRAGFHGDLWSKQQRYLAVLEEYRKELQAVRGMGNGAHQNDQA